MSSRAAAIVRDKTVPIFQLYGATIDDEAIATLHIEALGVRSGLHDWEIRPHRHGDLHQLLLIERGSGELIIDAEVRTFRAPCIIGVPAMRVHGFRFEPKSEGWVVTFAVASTARAAELMGEGALADRLTEPLLLALERPSPPLSRAFEALSEEFRTARPSRGAALTARLGLLLVEIARAAPVAPTATKVDRGLDQMHAFQALVEAHAADGWTVADYARAMSMTPARLNALCQTLAGRSPLQLVHGRQLLEAKRCLIHTAMSVSEISYALGFKDPAYFCRFFARHEGRPPSTYRRETGRWLADASF
jgi:AraC family transcriptional activator of pobA